jgi:hypothetical protein
MKNTIFSFFVFFIGVFIALNYYSKEIFAEEKAKIQKSDDVIVVANPKIPELKMRIVFKEELSIGLIEGDENYMFSDMISFNTDGDGNFYVSDMEALRIQKYSPEGKHLLTIGRKGQGPGEFQSLSVVRFDKDDNLYICDVTGRKISFFSKEGEFLKQINMPGAYENLYINSKGLMVSSKYEQVPADNSLTMFSTYELFDEEFTPLAELHKIKREMALPGRDLSSRTQIMANMINLMVYQPQEFLTLAKNDFIYFGHPDKYEINIFSPEGKLVKKITRDYEPVPVSKKDIKTFEEEISQEENFIDAPEDFRKKVFQLIKYPKYKPAYQSFTLVQGGFGQSYTLMENGWLALIVDSVKGEYTIFDLFNQEGRYIANFKTTVPVEGLFFNNGKAYSVATENDYLFVKRYTFEIQEYKDNKWERKK